jgi:hypothetical protein
MFRQELYNSYFPSSKRHHNATHNDSVDFSEFTVHGKVTRRTGAQRQPAVYKAKHMSIKGSYKIVMHVFVYVVYEKYVNIVTVASIFTKLHIKLRRSNSAGRAKRNNKEMCQIWNEPFLLFISKYESIHKIATNISDQDSILLTG